MLTKLLLACTIAYTVVLVVATHYPKPEDLLEYSPVRSDKTLHFIAYGIQGLLVASTLASAGHHAARSLAIAMAGLAVFAAIDEATQPLFGRYADPLDWVYDCIGLASGILLARVAAPRILTAMTLELPRCMVDAADATSLPPHAADDLFLNAPVAYATVDAAGCLMQVNRAFVELCGRPQDELIGTALTTITRALEEPPRASCPSAPSLPERSPATATALLLIRGDGTTHPVCLHANAIASRAANQPQPTPASRRVVLTSLRDHSAQAEALLDAASTDPLTGALNRTGFQRQLEPQIGQQLAEASPVAAVMCDLDHFKLINDAHGHATGDAVLKAAVQRIRETLRASDTIVRLGGDEFVVPLVANDTAAALIVAERIRSSLAEEPVCVGSLALPLTASLGVASSTPGDTWAGLIARADARLYQAKAAGRNRCVASDSA